MPTPIKISVPADCGDPQQVRQLAVSVKQEIDRINLGVLAASAGTPTDAPASGTARFDPGTNKLWVYNGAAWKSTTLA